jgi:hypothetical protein
VTAIFENLLILLVVLAGFGAFLAFGVFVVGTALRYLRTKRPMARQRRR